MKIKDFIPVTLRDGFKLFSLRCRFSKKNIYIESPYVSKEAKLDRNVRVLHDVQIRESASIGRYTYIEPYTTIINADIGAFCSIGKCCQIASWEHPLETITTSPEVLRKVLHRGDKYSDLPPKTVIGNDVWICSNSVIKGGINIGNGAVIGAGSVVTKDVPPYAIVVGNPARILRYRFDEEKIKYIESLKWWDLSDEELMKNSHLFLDGNEWYKNMTWRGSSGNQK